jgi:hypothetical protein
MSRTYVGDKKPGDANGQGVTAFGAASRTWWNVVDWERVEERHGSAIGG